MRPLKISPEQLSRLMLATQDKIKGMVFSDEDFLHIMNRGLPLKDRITYRTYQRYKAKIIQFGEMQVEEEETCDPAYYELYDLLMDNNIEQKSNLWRALLEAEGNQWQKYRWILERKYPEFNAKCQSEPFMAQNNVTSAGSESKKTEDAPITIVQPERIIKCWMNLNSEELERLWYPERFQQIANAP